GGRAAVLDGAHHLELVEADAAAVDIAPCRPVAAEDVRDLQSWAGHAGRLCRRSSYSLWDERRQPVQRAHDLPNQVGGHLGVARRRVELGMPEQDLNHANVDVLLEQMGSEAVAQRVRRYPFGQRRQFSGHVADAIELARGHWADAVAPREHPYRRASDA